MTYSPPPDRPPTEPDPLGFDDFIGILVALASIGAILAWGLTRSTAPFGLSLPSLTTAPSPRVSPGFPIASPTSPAIIASPPVVAPSPLPPGLTPVQVPPRPPALVPLPQPSVAPIPQASPPAVSFLDVPSNFWASPFVNGLAARSIVTGKTANTFRPNDPVTRAEFAVLVEQAFEQPNQFPSLTFNDLPAGYWATEAIDRAVRMGFMRGYPDGSFQPDRPIPRYQALMAIASGLSLPPLSDPNAVLNRFQDANRIVPYGVDQVAAATNAGLVVNHPEVTRLNPQQITTRAEAAAVIYQALVQQGKVNPVSSPYIVRP